MTDTVTVSITAHFIMTYVYMHIDIYLSINKFVIQSFDHITVM